MKHYLIGPSLPPVGGVSNFIYRCARRLREQGNQVEIVDLGDKPSPVGEML